MTTAAIVCIARNESPFVEEWARYHIELGFDRLYYISTDVDFGRAERTISESPLRPHIEVLHFDDFQHGWQIRCYNAHLPLVEEDWILVLDVDEFLYLQPFTTVHEYLATIGDDVGQIQFPWLLKISSSYSRDSVLSVVDELESYVSDHVKSMVRRECTGWLGIHAHDVQEMKNCLSSGAEVEIRPRHPSLLAEPTYVEHHPIVLHFASRGHLDTMTRIIDHQFFNSKSGQPERERLARFLVDPVDWSSIPTRCLLLQFYRSLPRTRRHLALPQIDAQTDLRALREIFLTHIGTLVDFECSDLGELEERFEQRYRYALKLSALGRMAALAGSDVAGPDLAGIDEYLECGTQEEYTDRLRHSLIKP